MSEIKRLDRLPEFPSPPPPADPSQWRLRIGGLVEALLALTYEQILMGR